MVISTSPTKFIFFVVFIVVPLGYERVCLPLLKVADAHFNTRGDLNNSDLVDNALRQAHVLTGSYIHRDMPPPPC